MIKFFRKIRLRLLNHNQTTKYIIYAIGEISLVMIGILLALQVNLWNENRKDELRFRFALEQLYQELSIDILMSDAIIDAAKYKFQLIEQLQNDPGSIQDSRLIRSLLSLDYDVSAIRTQAVNTEFRESLIEFNPGKSFQNELSSLLLRYITKDGAPVVQNNRGSRMISDYLIELQVMDFPMQLGETFEVYIANEVSEADSMWYNQYGISEDLLNPPEFSSMTEIRALFEDPDFQSNLHLKKIECFAILSGQDYLADQAKGLLRKIDEYIPGHEIKHEQIYITGGAEVFDYWKSHIPMERVDEDGLKWSIDIELPAGYIKFRTDNMWIFNWGAGYTSEDKLVFSGPNIHLDSGKYRIQIDLDEGIYEAIPQKN